MSGGSFNYLYSYIEDAYAGKMQDKQLNSFIGDLCILLKSLEWYTSGDTGEEDYIKDKEEFKKKWLKEKYII